MRTKPSTIGQNLSSLAWFIISIVPAYGPIYPAYGQSAPPESTDPVNTATTAVGQQDHQRSEGTQTSSVSAENLTISATTAKALTTPIGKVLDSENQVPLSPSPELSPPAAAEAPPANFSRNEASTPESAPLTEEAFVPPPEDSEVVVVTGSRIARRKLQVPVPVTVISSEFLEDSGSLFLNDIIAQTPQIQPTFTSANSTRFIGTTGFGGIDLRGLSTDRTLVLVNGRRHVGGAALSTAIDLNTISIDLIDRFEVLTGGASATYGSDAVAGVVNIILKEDFEGSVLRGQYGLSERGDAENWLVSGTVGNSFANDRGNAVLAFEYTQRSRVNAADRDFASTEFRRIPNPADTDRVRGDENDDGIPDEILTPNAGLNILNRYGIVSPGGRTQTFNPDGSIRDFDFGDRSPIAPERQVGGDYLRLRLGDLVPRQERFMATSLLSYKFSDYAKLYSEAKFVLSRAEGAGTGQPSFDAGAGIPVLRDNAFLPDDLGSQLDVLGLDQVGITRFNNDLGLRSETSERTTLRTAVGLKGDINPNIHYDVGFTWGRTEAISQNNANRVNARFLAASDAVVDENGVVNGRPGEIVCRVNLQAALGAQPTLPNGSSAPDYVLRNNLGNCVPMSLFGFGGVSPQASAFINSTTSLRSTIEQLQVMGFVSMTSKDIFELPAGPIAVVLGAEYRRDEATQFADLGDSLELTFFNAFSNSRGSVDVAEVFGELSLPLLADLPGVEELTLTAGGRISDYSLQQVGTVWTGQVNGLYQPIRDLALRGSYALAIRAPNVGDAFSGLGQSFGDVDDPCDDDSINTGSEFRRANCVALAERLGATFAPGQRVFDDSSRELLQGGNPNLEEETSTSWTVGFQFNPRWVPNLLIAVDYYNYAIENAIIAPGPQRIANNCVDLESIDNQFCDLVTRNSSDLEIELIQNVPVNAASLETRGIDFSLSYALKLQQALQLFGLAEAPKSGVLRLNFNGNHVVDYVNFPDQMNADEREDLDGFFGYPKWRWTLSANYDIANINFNYRVQWIDGYSRLDDKQEFDNNPDALDPIQTDAINYHYLQVRYSFLDQFSVYAGVDNLFDTTPPIALDGTSFGSAFYDNLLRRFYVGARWNGDIF
ncbi:MAG: TonB-dependent receptor [Myxococcales bacterium]|nr:TonB-dependent receptor [Myxococcales bacterium]